MCFFSFLNEHVVTFDYTSGLHIDLIPGLLFLFLFLEKQGEKKKENINILSS